MYKKLALVAFIAGALLPTFAMASEDGLVASWNFSEPSDDMVIDSTGNGSYGTLEKGVLRYPDYERGPMLEFDGYDDRILLYTKAPVNFLDSFTVSAWVRPTAKGGLIFRKSAADADYYSLVLSNEGKVAVRIGYSEVSGVWEGGTVPNYTWTHIAVSYTKDSEPRIYVNGVLVPITQVKAPKGERITDSPYAYIGDNHDHVYRSSGGFDQPYQGRLDTVHVYNRAIAAEDVLSDYNEHSLLGEWKFEETGLPVTDTSLSGNTGTLENGAQKVASVMGNAASFDGTDDRVRIDTKPTLQGVQSLTASAWIKPVKYGGAIVRKGNENPARFALLLNTDGTLGFKAGYSGKEVLWSTATQVPVNTWTHVAATYSYDTSKTPLLYINGIAQPLKPDAQTATGTPAADSALMFIGSGASTAASQIGYEMPFAGLMDTVRLYGAELGAADVRAHTLSAIARYGIPPAMSALPIVQDATTTTIHIVFEDATSSHATSTTPSGNIRACGALNATLSLGMRDGKKTGQVTTLQNILQLYFGTSTMQSITGYFGPQTKANVIKLQKALGVPGTGLAGPLTRNAITKWCKGN